MANLGVSILIPTHNRGVILDRSLQSLAEMDYPSDVDVEIVVCANACTDNTVERVSALATQLPHLRCVVEPNTGLGHARNRCVIASRHEICALLDDDVWVSKGWLAGLAETYRSTPADLVAGHIELWWESVARPSWLTPSTEMLLSCLDLGTQIIEMRTPDAIGANFSFRREVFSRIGPFRADIDRIGTQLLGGGETYFVREAMKAGHRLFYSPRASIKHWVSPHRVQAPYMTGVAQGIATTILLMKERFGTHDAARALLIGGGRVLGHSLAILIAQTLGAQDALMRARIRRAIGLGQWHGAIARFKRGPLCLAPQTSHTP